MSEYTFGFDISNGEDKTALSIMKGKNIVCVLEGDTAKAVIELLEAERAKVAALMGTVESQKQTHDALVKRCRELGEELAEMRTYSHETVSGLVKHRDERIAKLEAQNCRMRGCLNRLNYERFVKEGHVYKHELLHDSKTLKNKDCLQCQIDQALSTPTEES